MQISRLAAVVSSLFIAASVPAHSAVGHVSSSGLIDDLHEWLPQSFLGKKLTVDFFYDDSSPAAYCGPICTFDAVRFSSAQVEGYRAEADNGVVVTHESPPPSYNVFNFRSASQDSDDGDCCAPEGGTRIYGETISRGKVDFFPVLIGITQQSSMSFTDSMAKMPETWPDLSQLDVASRLSLCFAYVRDTAEGPARRPEDIACMNATQTTLSFAFVEPLPGCEASGGVPPKCDRLYPRIDKSLPLVDTEYLDNLPAPVPLPASGLLIPSALAGLAALKKSRKRSAERS